MPNTKLPHSSENVFTGRPNGVFASSAVPGVVQDKGALARARTASPQPAPHENGMRPHRMNSNAARSQTRPTPKRKLMHLTLWVKPIVKAELQRKAEQEGMSVSAVGAALLERAVQADIDMGYGALLQPVIEHTVRNCVRRMIKPLLWFMARIAIEDGQTRHLATNILGRQQGMNEAKLNTILEESERAAHAALSRRTPQLRELMEELEAWLGESGEEEAGDTPHG